MTYGHVQGEVGDIESEWAMFMVSIANAASRSCGPKVMFASCGGNQRTRWWTLAVMVAVKLKEAFRTCISWRTPEEVDRYRVGRRTIASMVADAKLGHGRNLGRPWRWTFG